jgi:hypothetical protein
MWFQLHPDRSHRMRPVFQGEFDFLTEEERSRMVGRNHVIVRQVSPGERIRNPVDSDLARSIGDEEASVHALFDVISARRAAPQFILLSEINDLADTFRTPQSSEEQ